MSRVDFIQVIIIQLKLWTPDTYSYILYLYYEVNTRILVTMTKLIYSMMYATKFW